MSGIGRKLLFPFACLLALACLLAAPPFARGGLAQARDAGPDARAASDVVPSLEAEVGLTPVNYGADCRVTFRLRNAAGHDVYIDWFNSYSKRMGPYFWRRMANLTTGEGYRVRKGTTRTTTRLIRQGCTTRRSYRLRVHTDTDGDGNFREQREKWQDVWIPPRPSAMVEYTHRTANDLSVNVGICLAFPYADAGSCR